MTRAVSTDLSGHGRTGLGVIQSRFGGTVSDDAESLLVRYAVAVERPVVDVSHSLLDSGRRGVALEQMHGM